MHITNPTFCTRGSHVFFARAQVRLIDRDTFKKRLRGGPTVRGILDDDANFIKVRSSLGNIYRATKGRKTQSVPARIRLVKYLATGHFEYYLRSTLNHFSSRVPMGTLEPLRTPPGCFDAFSIPGNCC